MAYELLTLYKAFACETHWLQEQFDAALPKDKKQANVCGPPHSMSKEVCAIRLLDAWSRFCKELVVCSASRQPLTAVGNVLPLAPGITRPQTGGTNFIGIVHEEKIRTQMAQCWRMY